MPFKFHCLNILNLNRFAWCDISYSSILLYLSVLNFVLDIIPIIEGLRAKRAYIKFLADFHFLQDCSPDITYMYAKKLSIPLETFCSRKTKETFKFVLPSFISHIIMVISYCCFVSASD